ncbi:hypothetical protein QAD02_006027 [Eretmocerus hayati]|uniref:Uncharacterized protein n=1 Tax=Eretmocerus hayati TaxID=131215 RepID=A0ACC2N3V0_9HYME|nr:hypothetical protein QAD02_006027 [Eretmocerus hayati]
MAKIHLRVFTVGEICEVPIETLIALFTIKFCDSMVRVVLVRDAKIVGENSFGADISAYQYEIVECSELSDISKSCHLPNFEENDRNCIAGLCATLRQIIKNTLSSNPEHPCKDLLGFKESCLLACSEVSVWTKFCEIDIVCMLRNVMGGQDDILPIALARFESHMSQPVRLHNVYKYTMSKKFSNSPVVQDRSVVPEHTYAEGLTLSLADIIIFVCIHIFFNFVEKKQICAVAPLTVKWYENMMTKDHVIRCLDVLYIENLKKSYVIVNYVLPTIEMQSLYKSDFKRSKPRNRIFTKQDDVDNSLEKIRSSKLNIHLDKSVSLEDNLDWSNIPRDATPEGGDLPNTRLQRKFQQLESLCKPILKLAKDGDVIVDFCSGGGHLGILLAYLLPKCNIVLLENKAKSIEKARVRVERLSLKNVIFYQSNLDYFKGRFDIGTSLHACGVATDLVLQQCIKNNAAFVCCPCCYGSIQDCDLITYPRSQAFRDILDKKSYFVLGHAADQTHDAENIKTKQGYECMSMIDSDRRLQAEECGYQVYLDKLKPESCSPKNDLLVGWPKTRTL